jgi:hypothetical protein
MRTFALKVRRFFLPAPRPEFYASATSVGFRNGASQAMMTGGIDASSTKRKKFG